MVILLVAVYAIMELREFYPTGSDVREGLKSKHFMLGLAVLALVIVRVVPLAGENKALAGRGWQLHEMVASVGYYLIAFHAAAALVHHYIVKDDTLRRKLPGRKSGSAQV